MGLDADLGALRVSLGPTTERGDIDQFLAAFARINRRRASRVSGTAAAA
jgi:cysteine desulfurase